MTTNTQLNWPTFESSFSSIVVNDVSPFQWMTHINRLKLDGYTIFKNLLPEYIFQNSINHLIHLKKNQLNPLAL